MARQTRELLLNFLNKQKQEGKRFLSYQKNLNIYRFTNNIKGTVARVLIGPCIVLMDRPEQAHVSRRFLDF